MNINIIADVLEVASTAGKAILKCRHNKMYVHIKPDKTQQTAADEISNRLIKEGLKQLTPHTPIISEESTDNHLAHIRQYWQTYWLIDPLDGTRNFSAGSDEFCINIAYIFNHRPLFGLIYDPSQHIYFYAHRQLGAFKKKNNQTTILNVRKKHTPLKITIGNYSSKNKQLQTHLQQQQSYRLYPLGSALKFAYIAQGHYDYYPKFGLCSEWDTAAGVCVLECAGGRVVDYLGRQLFYNKNRSLKSPNFFAMGKW